MAPLILCVLASILLESLNDESIFLLTEGYGFRFPEWKDALIVEVVFRFNDQMGSIKSHVSSNT